MSKKEFIEVINSGREISILVWFNVTKELVAAEHSSVDWAKEYAQDVGSNERVYAHFDENNDKLLHIGIPPYREVPDAS